MLPRKPGLLLTTFALLLISASAFAQPSTLGDPVPTNNTSVKITTGLTYQQILPAVPVNSGARRSVTIQNNQTSTDNCFLVIGTNQIVPATTTTATAITINGVSVTAAQASIVLGPGTAYQRYFPYVPSDIIYGTCATTGDSMYVDTQ
jgi:hypothetical protein